MFYHEYKSTDTEDFEEPCDEWSNEALFCGYDYNGAELYIGHIVRIGADEYGEKYVVGTIVGVSDEGIHVEFTEIYDVGEYGPYDT